MTLSETPGSLNQIRRAAPKFQRTFATPLDDLQRFVAAIVCAGQIEGGCLTVDQVVLEPVHLIDLLKHYSLPPQYGRGLSLIAACQDEVKALLHAAFSDSIDFLFIPKPKPFTMYADHDEFTTFYAHTRSQLNRIAKVLSDQGVKTIQNYERRL
jgi:hypothetical protein